MARSKVTAYDAAFTFDEVETGVRNAKDGEPIRRRALLALTQSSDQLLATCKEDQASAEAMLDLVEDLNRYLEWRKTDTEMLEAVRARIASVLVECQRDAARALARKARAPKAA